MKTIAILILSVLTVNLTEAQKLIKLTDHNRKPSVEAMRQELLESFSFTNRKKHQVNMTTRHFKSAQDLKTIQLDSSKYDMYDPTDGSLIMGDKTIFTYTGSQKMASETNLILDPVLNSYTYNFKQVNTYNDRNNLIRNSTYQYDYDSQNWYESGRYEYTYDDKDRLSQEIQSYMYDQNTLMAYSKDEYSYDENNNVTQATTSLWNPGSNTWDSYLKQEQKYDSMNNMESYQASIYDTDSQTWISFVKLIFEQEDSVTKNGLAYFWNDSTGDWMALNKYQVKTDISGDTLSYADYVWNADDSTWSISDIESWTYNEAHLMTSDIYQYKDDSDNSWHKSDSVVYDYDNNGNLILLEDFTWNEEESVYLINSKTEREYDLSTDGQNILLPKNSQSLIIIHSPNQLLSESDFQLDESGTSMVQSGKRKFFYSNFHATTGIRETSNVQGISFYPNPVQDQLTVTNMEEFQGQINILDLSGRSVMTEKLNTSVEMNMTYLNPGIYILQITNNGQILYSEKFIKQ